jgi:hypothetical protein
LIGRLPIKSMSANGYLIMAIMEVITRITIPTENHLILPEDLFGLNPKQLDIKLRKKG